jgi:RimJ/RimL family protein N-acetyltransferase
VGPVPDELVVSWLELSATLMTEAPQGEMEWEDEAVDVAAFRHQEHVLKLQRRERFHTVALDGEGRVVAYTDLVVPSHAREWVFQWGTLVHREHRGHRLGTAVKVANLRSLQGRHPAADLATRRLVTWNAEVNDHMIGINERLGFRPIARAGELQKKL